ncbi:DUF3365 domain-containing protein [Methyloceanibacter sp. wino2]|uniref:Tll0287-like domain-containing protein n=1 Tax=Methyloceanibacter sp. wino2 TaxID=2170729 RepID=UPI000D3E4584|nr:DUF3365 domain-containing protein [Methyloceanibacter sp. wino2]
MRYRSACVALSLCLATSVPAAVAENAEPTEAARADQSRHLSKSYGEKLKAALVGAMKAGGPESAIAFCNVAAPEMAKQSTVKSGWSLGRTALKVRNPENAPDEWERTVLLEFQDKINQGADAKSLEHYETTTKDDERVFRYMKAIPTQGPCLTCHGSNVSPSVKATIEEFYPDDQATGFELGELRGAFTITQPMP